MEPHDDNPYAAPRTDCRPELETASEPEYHAEISLPARWGTYLVVPRDAVFSSHCVWCGKETDEPIKCHRVFWYSPLLLLILLFVPWFSPFLALCFRKDGEVHCTLCKFHARKRFRSIITSWSLVLLALLLAYVAFQLAVVAERLAAITLIAAGASLLGAILVALRKVKMLRVRYIGRNVMWLRDLPPAFWADLPELPTLDGYTPILPEGYQ